MELANLGWIVYLEWVFRSNELPGSFYNLRYFLPIYRCLPTFSCVSSISKNNWRLWCSELAYLNITEPKRLNACISTIALATPNVCKPAEDVTKCLYSLHNRQIRVECAWVKVMWLLESHFWGHLNGCLRTLFVHVFMSLIPYFPCLSCPIPAESLHYPPIPHIRRFMLAFLLLRGALHFLRMATLRAIAKLI